MKRAILMTVTVALAGAAGAATQPLKMNNSHPATNGTELATFAGGCFWCMEAVFQQLPGVLSVTSGYTGGHKDNPTYRDVCSGQTGHAEAIQIRFDPKKISYDDLLEVFWEAHDPTTLNRQGPDEGTQYRSAIFFGSEAQRVAAAKCKAAAAKDFLRPIVTRLEPLKQFYPAEGYHQDYYRNNSNAPYCQVVIRPKLEKLKKQLEKPRTGSPSPAP
jgi:peptide-methionine (S)-S-oxide reductase